MCDVTLFFNFGELCCPLKGTRYGVAAVATLRGARGALQLGQPRLVGDGEISTYPFFPCNRGERHQNEKVLNRMRKAADSDSTNERLQARFQ
jgi:hypothetical protein